MDIRPCQDWGHGGELTGQETSKVSDVGLEDGNLLIHLGRRGEVNGRHELEDLVHALPVLHHDGHTQAVNGSDAPGVPSSPPSSARIASPSSACHRVNLPVILGRAGHRVERVVGKRVFVVRAPRLSVDFLDQRCLLGIGAAILVLYLLGSEELKPIFRAFKTRFWKTEVVAPSQEEL